MKISAMLVVALGLGASAPAQTHSPEVRRISLQDCIQAALAKNLDLRIARYSPQQARLDLTAAYAGYDPTFFLGGQHGYSLSGGGYSSVTSTNTLPSTSSRDDLNSSLKGKLPWGLGYTLSGDVSETSGFQKQPFDQSAGSTTIEVKQPLLKNFWIDDTRLAIRVNKNKFRQSELGLKQTIMNTATTVEQAYYDLIAARESVKVQEKAVEIAAALLNENNKRVEFGAMTPLDAQDAEAQVASSQAALIVEQQALNKKLETLKGLISDDFAAWSEVDLVPVDTLTTNRQSFDLPHSWNTALTGRPDLLQARLDVENQGVTLKYNRNQLFPELDLVGSYGHNASGAREFSGAIGQLGSGSQPAYFYGAQISFPILNTAARAKYRQGKFTLETLLLTLKKKEQDVLIAVHTDIGAINADYDNLGASRKAREFAEAALEAERIKLQNGKSTTYTVLQKQRDVTTARASEISALTAYNKALSQLSLDQAQTLERLGINLDVK